MLKHEVAKKLFGRTFESNVCIFCGSNKTNPEDFDDDLSRKEWEISHLCQACQDDIFGKEDEDYFTIKG